MVNVTADARELLDGILQDAAEQEGAEVAVRLTPMATDEDSQANQLRPGLMLNTLQDRDHVVEHNGRKVLLIEIGLAQALDGFTIDAVDTPEGRSLSINQ